MLCEAAVLENYIKGQIGGFVGTDLTISVR